MVQTMKIGRRDLMAVYDRLHRAFGPQGWWPGETPFEVAVGAILTQNTNWGNVEKALANLKGAGLLTPRRMAAMEPRRLAALIRPAGFFNLKAERIGCFLRYLAKRHGLRMEGLLTADPGRLRRELLEVRGIGPETADSILLYAAGHPFFVVDGYTRRIFSRHGFVDHDVSYDHLQEFFTRRLPEKAALFNEFHALIVTLGKQFCRPRSPRCEACPLDPP
jgi:endonuclease-3 related protein